MNPELKSLILEYLSLSEKSRAELFTIMKEKGVGEKAIRFIKALDKAARAAETNKMPL